MADLFDQIGDLFRGRPCPDPPPSFWIVHRFLCDDPDYAQVVKEVAPLTYNDEHLWYIWQSLLPEASGAPMLRYPAPKKPKAAEGLVKEVMGRHGYSREKAEAAVTIVEEKGLLLQVCTLYGVEEDDE